MPTQTFFNLPETKRSQFVEAAFDEFIRHDYEHASISAIVKRLGIGKGSVYRYFLNKKDLYEYLCQLAEQSKMVYLQEVMTASHEDFFELYRALYKGGIRYMQAHPRYNQFLYNVSQDRSSLELGDRRALHKQMAIEAFIPQIQARQAEGQLRTDIDAETMAFMVVAASQMIGDYILLKHKTQFEAAIHSGNPLDLSDTEMDRLVNAFMLMLSGGIQAPVAVSIGS